MLVVNHVPQLLDVGYAASTRSDTLQKLGVTPAAIAGVHRSVLRRTPVTRSIERMLEPSHNAAMILICVSVPSTFTL